MITPIEVARRRNLLEIVKGDTREACRSTQEGRQYFFSPFRKENSPSFIVNKFKGKWWWRDFGSGESGDTIEYVMRRDSISFKEAVERLSGMPFKPSGKLQLKTTETERIESIKQRAFEQWELEYSDSLAWAIKTAHKTLIEAKTIDEISDRDANLISDLAFHEWQYDILCSRDVEKKEALYKSL